MRTFEYRDGKSAKFWAIDLQGDRFTVTFGRSGTSGQTQTKSFADETRARAAHDKLIAEKLKKGYVETASSRPPGPAPQAPGGQEQLAEYKGRTYRLLWSGRTAHGERAKLEFLDGGKQFWVDAGSIRKVAGPAGRQPATTPTPARRALEEALAADPDDRAAHAAYADLLQEEGDPRGELISVQLALEDPRRPAPERRELQRREKDLLKGHTREWLGELAPFLLARAGHEYQLARGWLDNLVIGPLTVPFARALARAPQARLLRRLVIQRLEEYDSDLDDEAEAYEPGPDVPRDEDAPGLFPLLRSANLGNVRVFQLGETVHDEEKYQGQTYDTTDSAGAVDLIHKMPRLEELYWLAHGDKRDLEALFGLKTLGHLRVLQVYHVEAVYPLDRLARNPALGRLTHLALHPHGWDFEVEGREAFIELPDLRALLRSPHLKGVTHLRVHCSSVGDAGCQEVVDSGALERLKLLDLRHGTITDDGARTLAACPDLKNLKVLDVAHNALTRRGVNALKATGVPVRAGNQQDAEDLEMRRYLYEGDYE
jgi:uncharacterized protein (TIGR02996 family)